MVHFSGWGGCTRVFSDPLYFLHTCINFLPLSLFLVDGGSCFGEKHNVRPRSWKDWQLPSVRKEPKSFFGSNWPELCIYRFLVVQNVSRIGSRIDMLLSGSWTSHQQSASVNHPGTIFSKSNLFLPYFNFLKVVTEREAVPEWCSKNTSVFGPCRGS